MTGLPLVAFGHDPAQVRELARQLLGGPPYRAGEEGALRRALTEVVDLLGRVLSETLGTVGTNPAVAWGIALVGLAVLAALVWRVTRGTTLGRRGPRAALDGGTSRSAADWLAEGARCLGAGDLEGALRARYIAAVVTLEERGLLDPQPGRTIGELDTELRRRLPELAAVLGAAGQRVEQVVFGGRTATRGDLEVVDGALAAARGAGRVEVGASR